MFEKSHQRIAAAILGIVALAASADEGAGLATKAEIDRVLASIPSQDRSMPYKTLGERLPNLGLVVKLITYGQVEPDEVKQSGGLYKRGDVLYRFSTNEPNPAIRSICPISSVFSLVKRGSKWLPDDRTANFLVSARCVAP